MNPLQEYPHLFTNGKFSIEWPADGLITEVHGFEKYVGPDGKDCFILADGDYLPVEHCTLIARPISDMTDEELINMGRNTFSRSDLNFRVNDDKLSFKEANNLLSIGVYPFDQTHFEDGTIISINDL